MLLHITYINRIIAHILVYSKSLYDLQGRVNIFAELRDYVKKGVAEKSNLAGSVGVTVFFCVYWDQYQQLTTEISLFQDICRYSYFFA